jgi:hypothetical protein
VVDLSGAYLKILMVFITETSPVGFKYPNRQVVGGDAYGYNYKYAAKTLDAFTQFKFNYNKVDFM